MSTSTPEKSIKYLVVDTTAFIQNESLLHLADNIVSVAEVVSEIKNKRQLRRLCFLPYELIIKDVFPENVKIITDFSKKTGDYSSLSATDIKVMALTYQLEKELVGTDHLRTEPIIADTITNSTTNKLTADFHNDFVGFYNPDDKNNSDNVRTEVDSEGGLKDDSLEVLKGKFGALNCEGVGDELESVKDEQFGGDDDDDIGWITPGNVKAAKRQMNNIFTEDNSVQISCMTTDFAMQNVLKQMNLNVSALDGRLINQLRTFILRCYTCFKTTSIITSIFCPKCGNNTLKKVAVTVDPTGKQTIHINNKRPLTSRGKKFSLPTIKGGKHSRNPILVVDQPMPDQKPTRIARTKTNVLDDNYTAGYSPFALRDVNSKSAQLKIRSVDGKEDVKYWMRKNPNEAKRRAK